MTKEFLSVESSFPFFGRQRELYNQRVQTTERGFKMQQLQSFLDHTDKLGCVHAHFAKIESAF